MRLLRLSISTVCRNSSSSSMAMVVAFYISLLLVVFTQRSDGLSNSNNNPTTSKRVGVSVIGGPTSSTFGTFRHHHHPQQQQQQQPQRPVLSVDDDGSLQTTPHTTTTVNKAATTTMKTTTTTTRPYLSPLSLTYEELSDTLGGTGRAKACWDCFRMGVDPVWYYSRQLKSYSTTNTDGTTNNNIQTEPIHWDDVTCQGGYDENDDDSSRNSSNNNRLIGWDVDRIQNTIAITSSRRDLNGLGKKTLDTWYRMFGKGSTETKVATLSKITTCTDGTTKLLLKLQSDGLYVETVIIPWSDRQKSTVCVSSQVGCRQACTFCLTGRMGRLRDLSSAEILAQLYWANKVCRITSIFPIDNCVFMGMGEPADNVESVVHAAKSMVDQNLFQLAARRVTISTVAPTPDAFSDLAEAQVVLAWSIHSSRDEIRRQLVPTARYPVAELRDGLITTLQGRSKRLRNVMLEVTLLDQINDSPEVDATHMADFCQPLLEQVEGIKLVVNLIPWNDIDATFGPASTYRSPQLDRVLAYQKVLVERGVLCYVRTTRGDEENAACGMLSTSSSNNNNMRTKEILDDSQPTP